ncbi:solute carrier family 2, facilitated glucose transporter member 10 [Myxocyprinus asiaticus]|uniref:solute carrier family 2, facilitated glucose transporter member 10 n=1 Tax=Myxocyprinus asiaticus TaxID=70543 RepID=UPI00222320E5|nr:solute carrier family 2, facilitated glucose transporter member 10 [Myxocyprinus asiaticus]XP_051532587.1 solute carrier family 2, facilitated glucose transporter member 10 [Myxocyprinus asiaticus]XP_051532588.1 solute carrier family 2, facilitated glucose transporter member 10 [Myxocyprinus asiaticus]XP_051532589.1 solute carrier family 2, facilitated glucose transporter member 10 [Myxocyprinus asiaticus]
MGCPILVLTIIVSTLGGLVFGYELAIVSGTLPQLQAQFHLDCVQQESVVSALLIGALSASVVSGWIIDRHGRKASILLSNLLILGGTLILTTSTSFLSLVFGRAIIGFAMSISSMSCCIFVSEMVAPTCRGVMVTLYEVGITVGILLAYAVNYILTGAQAGWRYMFGLVAVPSLMQLVSIEFLPQQNGSSVSLMAEDESQQSDRLAEGTSNQNQPDNVQYSVLHLFKSKNNMWRRTAIGLGLVLSQQFTGQPNVLFYASTILYSVGFQSNASADLASVGLGFVKVIATLVAMVCSDKVGRRSLLIGGCSVMAVGLMLTSILSWQSVIDTTKHCSSLEPNSNLTLLVENQRKLDNNSLIQDQSSSWSAHETHDTYEYSNNEMYKWAIFICMMAVVSAFSVSFGPMTWLVLSEIFPKEVRGRAFAFINCFNVGANLIVSFSFLNIIDVIGLFGTFLMYGVIGMAAAVFIYLVLPETNQKSLYQIDRELSHKRLFHSKEFCNIFQRSFSPGYQRVHWTSTSI